MKQWFSSLRVRMLLPVIFMSLFVVILQTVLFSNSYIGMILDRENEVNAVSFDTISHTLPPLISNSVDEVRRIMADFRVQSYVELQYETPADLVWGRISCRDYLQAEIARHTGVSGILIMRNDGSLFGALPEANFFFDAPEQNPIPKNMTAQIQNAPLGETVWVGPLDASVIYGYESDAVRSVMIAAWKSVHVSYGECYAMMLMDESIFLDQFNAMQDRESTWHLFSADRTEICHTRTQPCTDPDRLISQSNTRKIFVDEDGAQVCSFSMTMSSPDWTVVRVVSMEGYDQMVDQIQRTFILIGSAVFLISLGIYWAWLNRAMPQFDSLLDGIVRIGEGDLRPRDFKPTSINELKRMQEEINKTSLALQQHMNTIRRLEREQAELESQRREQEMLLRELDTARHIQESMLPHIFPPFPDLREVVLYASMDPARDVGGDFYDFFVIDEDHLCLVIADVSGKGIPGAMFMMFSKRIIEDSARQVHTPSEILAMANDTLCDNNQADMFVTVWLGILEISTGTLTAANAGHEYPAVRKNGGPFELFREKHGFVLGAIPDARYQDYVLQLSPGDKLFVYTDGVPEATASDSQMFGTARMISALNVCADGSPEEILGAVRKSVDAFVGDAEPFDDLTMMCMEYVGPLPSADPPLPGV